MTRTLSLLVLALGGCATLPVGQSNSRTTYLVCGGATRLDIAHDGQSAVVRSSNGKAMTLRRSDSPLGTRYAANGISVLRSGDNYVFTGPDGTATSCSLLQR